MAVIQISKIQVRRGLQENLPQLASGEMGWSVDERRLWIGNGTLAEGAPSIGNTEILTQNSDVLNAIRSYSFRGEESGYRSRTGPTVTTAVTRYFQDKIDEQISARDFGAVGDGITDDTESLQRAIDQIFPTTYYTTVGVRRQIHIPAGVYLISSELTIPPYASIRGDGPLSTFIKQTGATKDCVIKLRDSRAQIDGDLGTNAATLPFQIDISNLTLENTIDKDVVILDSVTDIAFNRVNFVGALSVPSTVGDGSSAVWMRDTAGSASWISFSHCEFSNTTYGILAEGDISSVTVSDSRFTNLFSGLHAIEATTVSPQHIKIANSQFINIATQAIYSDDDSSVTSAFNYFSAVGNTNGVLVNNSTPTTSVVSWNTSANYSIGDIFTRSAADQLVFPLISIISADTQPTVTQVTTIGALQSTPGATITLLNDTSANTLVELSDITSSAIIDYSLVRDTARRIGTIQVTHYNGDAIYQDDYNESGTTGVTLGFAGNATANTATLNYITSNVGIDATFKYTIRSFI